MVLLKTVTNSEVNLVFVGKGLKTLSRLGSVEQQGTERIVPNVTPLIGTLNLKEV